MFSYPNLTQSTRLKRYQMDERREMDYVSIVTESIVRGINVERRKHSK
jgi:hypothetical protein